MSKKIHAFIEKVSELIEDKNSGVDGYITSESNISELGEYADNYLIHPDDKLNVFISTEPESNGYDYLSGEQAKIEVDVLRANGDIANYLSVYSTDSGGANKIVNILANL